MTDMVERVARAICRSAGENPDWFTANSTVVGRPAPQRWMDYTPQARAAIAAMRDVDLDVLGAGWVAMFETAWNATQAPMMGAGWDAMINAALADTAGGEEG